MKLTKMHGLGNDYLYFFGEVPENVEAQAIRLSDRHTGIGSDGLIYISDSDKADFRMRIFNADGSEAKMCGNGIRCVGRYVYEKGYTRKTKLRIETESGIRDLILHIKDGEVTSVSVDMGVVKVDDPKHLELNGEWYEVYPVSVGNPHAVIFVGESGLDLPEQIGSCLEHHPSFPGGVNAEFVNVVSDTRIRMRVWERGSGVTMACGTGACASAAASAARGFCKEGTAVDVQLDGGNLKVTVARDGKVWMEGPAEFVYDAEFHMRKGEQDD